LNVLVCVKQVPDPDEPLALSPETGWVEPAGGRWAMNRLDAFALEQALVLREAGAAKTVAAVSVGPPRAEAVVRRALAMGADKGMRVEAGEGFIDPLEAARGLARAARETGADLVLCGALSEDAMAGCTGPMAAALLDRPWVAGVVEISPRKHGLAVVRELEAGMAEDLEVDPPAVLTIQSSGITPRYPTLSHVLRANKESIRVLPAEGGEASLASGALMEPPPPPPGRFLEGTAREKAEKLADILARKGLL